MPNTCFWKASHFCQDRKWIFLQPEDGGPASVHPASHTGLGSVKELICHSHPQMVEGRCTTHFSGLLFINRVSLATTSSGLTHSAASKWLPCAHQASWGQSQNENSKFRVPMGGSLACKEYVLSLAKRHSPPGHRLPRVQVSGRCSPKLPSVCLQFPITIPEDPSRPTPEPLAPQINSIPNIPSVSPASSQPGRASPVRVTGLLVCLPSSSSSHPTTSCSLCTEQPAMAPGQSRCSMNS